MLAEFSNEPFTDFTDATTAADFRQALETVRAQFGKSYPLWIGGQEITVGKTFDSHDPALTRRVIGTVQEGSETHVDQAMQAALAAFETWRNVKVEKRADYLFEVASLMRQRKHQFSAWMVYEVGKSWAEADGDTAEAIDFLEFYAREALRYASPQPLVPLPGEANELKYTPLGVGAVIPPWNFPNAIFVGMVAASIVSGNTVVAKPSEDAPVIGWHALQLFKEVGVPDGVVNFITGPGNVLGPRMVEHPKTRFICFTGSKNVGLEINERAAKPQTGQVWMKRVIAEMGGKDSIIIDASADLDAAVEAVAAAAFGFSGQKCSACSRAIVSASIYDSFVEKIVQRAGQITMGHPEDVSHYMGPVINTKAIDKIGRYLAQGKQEGRLVLGGEIDTSEGYFVQPTIFADVPAEASISREEIFGPVLAIVKSNDWNHALSIANNTDYGLTGAVFTANEDQIQEARERFHVGNLYFNRKCTGALVGVHPFGGFNMSGTDSKAGGRDYLQLFQQAKLLSRAL